MPKNNKKHFRFLPTPYIPSNSKSTEGYDYSCGRLDSVSHESQQRSKPSLEQNRSALSTKEPSVSTTQDPIFIDPAQMQYHQLAERRTSRTARRRSKQSTAKKNDNPLITSLQNSKILRKEKQRVPTIKEQSCANVKTKVHCKNMSKTHENGTIPPGSENLLSHTVDDDGRTEKSDAIAAIAAHNYFVVKPAHILFSRSDPVTDPTSTGLDNAALNLVEEDIFLEDPNCKCIIPNLMLL